MAWIKQIDEPEATGLLAQIFEAARKRAGRVFNILRVQSQNPQALCDGLSLYLTVMKGQSPLTRAQREMLAVVVSKVNACHY